MNGCTDQNYLEYDSRATVNEGCNTPIVYGCMDSSFSNYNSNANVDDGNCSN